MCFYKIMYLTEGLHFTKQQAFILAYFDDQITSISCLQIHYLVNFAIAAGSNRFANNLLVRYKPALKLELIYLSLV